MPGETHPHEETADDADVLEESLDVDMEESAIVRTAPPPPPAEAHQTPSTASPRVPTSPGGEPTTARLLAQALTSKARAEDDKHKAEARAAAAEAEVAALRKQLESNRASSPPGEGGGGFDANTSKQLRNLREELEAAKATLDENFEEVAQLRVQLRKAEEAAQSASSASAPIEARARAAEDAVKASRDEITGLHNQLEELRHQLATALTQGPEIDRLNQDLEAAKQTIATLQHEAMTLQQGNEALVARSDIARLDADRTRAELERANVEIASLNEQLEAERALRIAAEAAQATAIRSLESERAAAHKENEVLGQALLEEEQQSARLREQLQAVNTRLAEVQRTQDSQSQSSASEVARMQKELFEAETERKEALERARKADREAKVLAKEVAALSEENKRLKTTAGPGTAPPAPDVSNAMAEELARAQKRLSQYGDEIKRLRAELASVGKTNG